VTLASRSRADRWKKPRDIILRKSEGDVEEDSIALHGIHVSAYHIGIPLSGVVSHGNEERRGATRASRRIFPRGRSGKVRQGEEGVNKDRSLN